MARRNHLAAVPPPLPARLTAAQVVATVQCPGLQSPGWCDGALAILAGGYPAEWPDGTSAMVLNLQPAHLLEAYWFERDQREQVYLDFANKEVAAWQ